MANLEKGTNGTISYPDFATFLKGGGIGSKFGKVDLSVWDQATMCAACHVGGTPYEKDRDGLRLPVRQMVDMGVGTPGHPGSFQINPFTSTVWESYDANGQDTSTANFAAWIYPATMGGQPVVPYDMIYGQLLQQGVTDPTTVIGTDKTVFGWGKASMGNGTLNGQLMMPNVKEMDCLFCHLQGYNNVMTSVMVQAGSLNAAPGAGAGLFDMFPTSPTYMGYNSRMVKVGNGGVVFLNNTTMVSRITAQPAADNCMQCHATRTLKDLPEMFGTTGTSNGFLSSAPMIYDPGPRAVGPLGRRMVSYDINSCWMNPTGQSTPITGSFDANGMPTGNWANYLMPGMPFLQAMGPTAFNVASQSLPNFLGGGNPGMVGPLIYNAPIDPAHPMGNQNQGVLKYSTMPFPRAEWFKRGDTWQDGQDLHGSLGCAGCHYTDGTDKTQGGKKNQCDPGRGFDMLSGIEDGVPPLKNRYLVDGGNLPDGTVDTGTQTPAKHDSRNTVKKCEYCHGSATHPAGTAADGITPINNYGAPDPRAAHQAYGLEGAGHVNVQMVDNYQLSGVTGGFGGQGIDQTTDATTLLARTNPTGSHIDIIDCSVCHVQKKSMTVRALDASSGMRFPVVLGTDNSKGMMGLFQDPAEGTDAEANATGFYNGVFSMIDSYYSLTSSDTSATGYLPIKNSSQACADIRTAYNNPTLDCYAMGVADPTKQGPAYQAPLSAPAIGGALQEWKPIHTWQKLGDTDLPLTAAGVAGRQTGSNGAPLSSFRRKITLNNAITAVLWNNTDPAVDANGDSVPGGLLRNDKAGGSLTGYKDIFTNMDLSRNNTQGYDEPIFDPWIMHDLKAGFNFGPAGFAPISVGFGTGTQTDPNGVPYMTMYNEDFTFTGAAKYASVWSGAWIFTEPEQITAYKNWRNTMEQAKPAAERKSWTGTELAFIGDPFLVTHGVKRTTDYVLGRNCADCHASGKGFFDGDYTMTGTAIPADRTFNPTSMTTPVDVNGNYSRVAALPDSMFSSQMLLTNMMQRGLETIPRIKAVKGDLRTSFEGMNKLGQPRSIKFEKDTPVQPDGKVYTYTTPLSRAEVLYPSEDLAIYYKITDRNSDGSLKAGAVAMNGAAYAAYLDTIGAAPVAQISTVAAADVTGTIGDTSTNPITVTQGSVALAATAAGPQDASNYTYTWSDTSQSGTMTGQSVAAYQFPVLGTYTLTLTVKNNNSNEVTVNRQYVKVVAPQLPADAVVASVSLGTTPTATITLTTIPAPHTKINVVWGDGGSSTISTADPNTTSYILPAHKYFGYSATKKSFTTKVYVYNSTTLMGKNENIVVTFP